MTSCLTIGIFTFGFILFNMRAVIQRVKNASCTVDNQITGQIQKGLMILLGVEEADTTEDLKWLGQKFINLRIFEDEQGLMNKSIQDIDGNILLISQFTLFAQTKKGNRPSFIRAAKPDKAKPMYEEMALLLSQLLQKEVQLGIFGADMKIDLLNDGPVTIVMDTKDKDNF
ncbi:D-tyrosyl-tRNA(Tyr) deacylase [compost metagenome]